MAPEASNLDAATVRGFGDEWSAFDQTALSPDESSRLFNHYFSIFPFGQLADGAEGFDLGCGSGRWAEHVAPRVGKLHCIDASDGALAVARRRLGDRPNVAFHLASVDAMPLADSSQDFGYSLGVLHHVPDTRAAIRECVRKLRPGAPLLLYLYYRFDNRPRWFTGLWKASDYFRRGVSRAPFKIRKSVTDVVAALVYWPLARSSKMLAKLGRNVSNIPLSAYRSRSFYTMRTDALDRFGTRLEQRFTRAEIGAMMADAGLVDIVFSEEEPFWVACGRRRA